ncbi:906_t:CDS:2, partial [Racocetra fulgida]
MKKVQTCKLTPPNLTPTQTQHARSSWDWSEIIEHEAAAENQQTQLKTNDF